jgi:hypothetical protein
MPLLRQYRLLRVMLVSRLMMRASLARSRPELRSGH